MHRTLRALRQLALSAAMAVPACLPSMASAAPITFDVFLEGSGISVFSATGTGAGGPSSDRTMGAPRGPAYDDRSIRDLRSACP